MKQQFLFSICLLLAAAGTATGQQSSYYAPKGIALGGYDVVAYFASGKPVKGVEGFATKWSDATWYFSSRANLDSFVLSPERYAPQYGGYCAYGTAFGHKSPTQPDAWAIINNKLYLNYNLGVKQRWEQNRLALIDSADKKWPLLRDH